VAYDDTNIFAGILRGEIPAVRVYEDDQTLAMLDIMPQSVGHTLILPKSPAEDLFDLDSDSAASVICTTQLVARAIRTAFEPEGMLLQQFNGVAAGQTVFHFHMHIVPRYEDQPLRGHSRNIVDSAVLERHAEKIRQSLNRMTEN